MAKTIDCGEVNPASGCHHVISGATEEEVLRKAKEHAERDHGMQLTPELTQKVRAAIKES